MITPTPVSVAPPPPIGSHSFVAALSIIMGIVVGLSTILGFGGRYFWVDRSEYNKDVMDVQKTLVEVRTTMAQQATSLRKQEQAFDRMAELVRTIEESLPRRRR